jgi:hypothetical protein
VQGQNSQPLQREDGVQDRHGGIIGADDIAASRRDCGARAQVACLGIAPDDVGGAQADEETFLAGGMHGLHIDWKLRDPDVLLGDPVDLFLAVVVV